MNSTLIDVLVPAYNMEGTIAESLRSILLQSLRDIQVIVVNDGSVDRTGEILKEIAASDSRVMIITTPNAGIVSALNTALAHSQAPYIARHDADDIAFPKRLEQQYAYLRENRDCIAVGGNALKIDQNGRSIGLTYYGGDVSGDATIIPAREPYMMHPFLMVRANALKAANGYRYVLHAEDSDLYWRLLGKGRLYNMHAILGQYRIHTNSVTSGSIHNGRVGSLYATLAALSHTRREQGKQDIPFPAESLRQMKSLKTMPEMIAYAAQGLSDAEMRYVRASSAAKLLQNATFRAYLIEAVDAAFINSEIGNIRESVDSNTWKEIRISLARVLLRLTMAGKLSIARELQTSALDYAPLARFAFRKLKNVLRQRRMIRADHYAKVSIP